MSAMNMMNVNFSKSQLDSNTDYQLSERYDHLDNSRPIYVCITKISNKAILTTRPMPLARRRKKALIRVRNRRGFWNGV